MKQERLEHYRSVLTELRARYRDEIRHMSDILPEELNPPGDDWGEPREAFDSEVETERTEMALYREVTAALERLDEGVFGQCVGCGRKIPEARLRVVPYAARCIECERQREQG